LTLAGHEKGWDNALLEVAYFSIALDEFAFGGAIEVSGVGHTLIAAPRRRGLARYRMRSSAQVAVRYIAGIGRMNPVSTPSEDARLS
jgi:hypothetical protein